jgi:uncharacterized RDD family membrane protein YckC
MFCSKCGANVPEGAAFCSACGQPVLTASAIPPAPPSPPAPWAPIATPPQPSAYVPAAQPAWQTSARPPVGYAGFWLRVVAAIIDGIVVSIPLAPFFFFFFASLIPSLMRSQDPMEVIAAVLPRLMVFVLVTLAISWLYWSLLESSAWQATLGKKVLGLYVTDISGQPATFARTSGRFFAGRGLSYIPSIGGLYFLISCICAGLTEKKQAVHDMIAGCLVLRKI